MQGSEQGPQEPLRTIDLALAETPELQGLGLGKLLLMFGVRIERLSMTSDLFLFSGRPPDLPNFKLN